MQIGDIILYATAIPLLWKFGIWACKERAIIKQQMQYGSLHRSALVMAAANQEGAEPQKPLSAKEIKAVYYLSQIPPGGEYTNTIQESIKTGNETVIRTMLKELREQLRVAPLEMEQLIGKDCCELIKN